MGRNARLKRERRAAKAAAGPVITLCNPETANFEAFIAGNATVCRNVDYHGPEVRCTEACTPMVTAGSHAGRHLVLCGAGPSLATHAAEFCGADSTADVWGCNSAATWLKSNGYRVTHAFAIDQTPHMVAEWADPPEGIEYLLATSVHPHLVEHLVTRNRFTRFFHNYVGIRKPPVQVEPGMLCEYEDFLYMTLYPSTVRCGSGLNSVTRALDLAQFMGYATITILGADCALVVKSPPPNAPDGSEAKRRWLEEETVMHADGGHALASGATPVVLSATIDGRLWVTKPDMVISAQWLMRMARSSKGVVRLVGDTLPNALMDKGEAFLSRLPALTTSDGQPIQFPEDAPPAYAEGELAPST